MTEEPETLKLVIDKLEEGNFSYYLTGYMATSFYSVPRMRHVIPISLYS